MIGAGCGIAIDRYRGRLKLAADKCGAETINYEKSNDVVEILKDITGGRGPDACIDAVGFEAHGATLPAVLDEVKYKMRLVTGKPDALRQAIQACRKGGTASIPGVYAGFVDRFPRGAAFAKGLTLRMGQTYVHKYMRPLMDLIEQGKVDPTFLISDRLNLREAPEGYRRFDNKEDSCVKVV